MPFLIKPPRDLPLDPGISDSLVELVDFYATAMSMAGVSPTHTHFGRDLSAVLADRSASVRDFVCCEGGRLPGETHCDEYHDARGREPNPRDMYWPKKMAQSDDTAHSKGIMLRTDRYKYVSRLLGSDELYDMEADPRETTNLISDPSLQPVVTDLRYRLMKWLMATDDVVPYEEDQRFTREMLLNKGRSVLGKGHDDIILAKIDDGAGIGELMGYLVGLLRSGKVKRGE